MKNILIILLLLGAQHVFSQSDEKAKSILDKVSETTKGYNSITTDFTFDMENKEVDLKESSKGSIIIQGDQYHLTINGIEIYSDGTTQWTFMEDANEVNIAESGSDDDGMINPATLFTIYEKGFTNTYLGESDYNSTKCYKIKLVPTEEQEYEHVILTINQSNYQISKAEMFSSDQSKYTIKIDHMNTEKKYPDATFFFEKSSHPGVSVIDMR